MNVTAAIKNLQIEKLEITLSTVGKLDTDSTLYWLNYGFTLVIPYFNDVLKEAQVVIPSNIFGLFTLSDVTFNYFDHYIQMGLSPTFLLPNKKPHFYESESLLFLQ